MIYLEDGKTYITNNGKRVTVTKTDNHGCLSFKGDNGMHYTIGGHTRDADLDIAKRKIDWMQIVFSKHACETAITISIILLLATLMAL